jgi:hypothetical protein
LEDAGADYLIESFGELLSIVERKSEISRLTAS